MSRSDLINELNDCKVQINQIDSLLQKIEKWKKNFKSKEEHCKKIRTKYIVISALTIIASALLCLSPFTAILAVVTACLAFFSIKKLVRWIIRAKNVSHFTHTINKIFKQLSTSKVYYTEYSNEINSQLEQLEHDINFIINIPNKPNVKDYKSILETPIQDLSA